MAREANVKSMCQLTGCFFSSLLVDDVDRIAGLERSEIVCSDLH
jgi:hypothetical protein